MSIFAFDVKTADLLSDPVRGYAALCAEARDMLAFIAGVCGTEKWARPMVTCFGRTRDDQEAIYFPGMRQLLEHQGIRDTFSEEMARQLAYDRFSWHCLDEAKRESRAFDLRSSTYTQEQRETLMAEVRKKYPNAEILHHRVPGNTWHFHFGAVDPAGRPRSWL